MARRRRRGSATLTKTMLPPLTHSLTRPVAPVCCSHLPSCSVKELLPHFLTPPLAHPLHPSLHHSLTPPLTHKKTSPPPPLPHSLTPHTRTSPPYYRMPSFLPPPPLTHTLTRIHPPLPRIHPPLTHSHTHSLHWYHSRSTVLHTSLVCVT